MLASISMHPHGAAAQRLSGTVRDSAGQPIPEVRVELRGTGRLTATDANGKYEISAKAPGSYVVEMRRLGFQPKATSVMLEAETRQRLDAVLTVVARQLDAQTIAATAPDRSLARAGFYQRMLDADKGLLHGSFITPEQLELRRPSRITQILADLPGVRVAGGPRGGTMGIIMSRRGNCVMTVYLDGARAEPGSMARGAAVTSIWGSVQASRGGGGGTDWSIDNEIPASDVAAIEVYPLAVSTPARFQQLNGTCGVVAIWTKH